MSFLIGSAITSAGTAAAFIWQHARKREERLKKNALITNAFNVSSTKTSGCLFPPPSENSELVLHPNESLYKCTVNTETNQLEEQLITKKVQQNEVIEIDEKNDINYVNSPLQNICSSTFSNNTSPFVQSQNSTIFCTGIGSQPLDISKYNLFIDNDNAKFRNTDNNIIAQGKLALKNLCWKKEGFIKASYQDLLRYFDALSVLGKTNVRERNDLKYTFDSDLYVECHDNKITDFFQCPTNASFIDGKCVDDHECSLFDSAYAQEFESINFDLFNNYMKHFRFSNRNDVNTYRECVDINRVVEKKCDVIDGIYNSIYDTDKKECSVDWRSVCAYEEEFIYPDNDFSRAFNCREKKLFIPSCEGMSHINAYGEKVNMFWDYFRNRCKPTDCKMEGKEYAIPNEPFIRSTIYNKCVGGNLQPQYSSQYEEDGWYNFIKQSSFDSSINTELGNFVFPVLLKPFRKIPKYVYDEETQEYRLLDIRKDIEPNTSFGIIFASNVNIQTEGTIAVWIDGTFYMYIGGDPFKKYTTNIRRRTYEKFILSEFSDEEIKYKVPCLDTLQKNVFIDNKIVDTGGVVEVVSVDYEENVKVPIVGFSDDIHPLFNYFMYVYYPSLAVANKRVFTSINGEYLIDITPSDYIVSELHNGITIGSIRYFALIEPAKRLIRKVEFNDTILKYNEFSQEMWNNVKLYYGWALKNPNFHVLLFDRTFEEVNLYDIFEMEDKGGSISESMNVLCTVEKNSFLNRTVQSSDSNCMNIYEDNGCTLLLPQSTETTLAFAPIFRFKFTSFIFAPYSRFWKTQGWNKL